MTVNCGSLPSTNCEASKTLFVNGSNEPELRPREQPSPDRRVQYLSRLPTSFGYFSCSSRASCFSVSISPFHLATREAESTTVEASFVSRLTEYARSNSRFCNHPYRISTC